MATEGLSMLMFVSEELLKCQALAYYFMDNEFYSLLLESENFTLRFQFNNDIRPRTLLGEALFKTVVEHVAVEVSKTRDYKKAILLNDKISNAAGMLRVIICQYLDRAKPTFFCSCEKQGFPEAYEVQSRPKQEFSSILAKLDFKKLTCECGDLNEVVNCLDDIWAGFDMLCVSAEKIDRQLMTNAVNALERIKFIPQAADR
jgi:hypothetical protein